MRYRQTLTLIKALLLISILLSPACGLEQDTYATVPFNHQHTLFDQILTAT